MRNVRHMRAAQRRSYLLPLMTRTSSRPAWLHFLLTDLHFPGKLERNAQRRRVWTVISDMIQEFSWRRAPPRLYPSQPALFKINQAVQGRCMTRVKLNIRKGSAELLQINICFQIPTVKVGRHSFLSPNGQSTAQFCKKGGKGVYRVAYTDPCINYVRKDTTCSSYWP